MAAWAAETCSYALLICSTYYCELLLSDVNIHTFIMSHNGMAPINFPVFMLECWQFWKSFTKKKPFSNDFLVIASTTRFLLSNDLNSDKLLCIVSIAVSFLGWFFHLCVLLLTQLLFCDVASAIISFASHTGAWILTHRSYTNRELEIMDVSCLLLIAISTVVVSRKCPT